MTAPRGGSAGPPPGGQHGGGGVPSAVRGAVLGSFALCGALGILIATSVGGRVFDLWMPGGPFVLMGMINSLVLAFAIYVSLQARKSG